MVERGKRSVRVVGTRNLIDDERQQLEQSVARLFAVQAAIDRRAPARHRLGDLLRPAEAEFGQAIERVALALGRVERKLLLLGEESRLAFEQPDVMALDHTQLRHKMRGEGATTG